MTTLLNMNVDTETFFVIGILIVLVCNIKMLFNLKQKMSQYDVMLNNCVKEQQSTSLILMKALHKIQEVQSEMNAKMKHIQKDKKFH